MTFDEWLETGTGKQASDATTLGHAGSEEGAYYLKNRLRNAFEAGYLEGKRYEKDRIKTLLGLA